MHADARVGGPLAIEATNAGVQVPCVGAGTASITLDSRRPGGGAVPMTHGSMGADGHEACSAPSQHSRSFEVTQSAALADVAAASQPATAMPPDYCQEWRQAAVALAAEQAAAVAPVTAVVGSKQTGKSTFARLLVNSLLNISPMVAYLDTDCGQSEFTAPGVWHLGVASCQSCRRTHMGAPCKTQQPCRWHHLVTF